MSDDAALVLAAGKGTRMRSTLPKFLHRVAGTPMLARVLNTLDDAGFPCPTVVVGHGADRVRATFGDRCRYVDQREQLGTGHAARIGVDVLPETVRRVLLVHGDEPLISSQTYRDLLEMQRRTAAAIVLLTAHVTDTLDFGRVIRNESGLPVALLQQADLTAEQRLLREVNLGAYVFDAAFLRRNLDSLEPHPPKGELYLTDLIALAMAEDAENPVAAVTLEAADDLMGINDLIQLERATRTVYRETNRRLMASGVTIVDSASTFIAEDTRIEPDTIINPFTVIEGPSVIGHASIIGPGAHIRASRIGSRCTVLSSTVEEAEVDDDVRIGPYAHLRPGAHVESGCEIGNYAEVKNASLGPGTRMHHMSYIGDATVGRDVNISAGVITCNYDGVAKHQTIIEDGAFIGSDTMLRAPVRVGKRAYTGAGSVVTRDVPEGKTVMGVPARMTGESEPHDADGGVEE